jgi:2-phosphoglycerate kinase
MIYLIGGPPKCGKTTLAKRLSKEKGIPWVSTDTLQCVIKPYINKKDLPKLFPTSFQRGSDNDEKYSKHSTDEIIEAYQQQAKTSCKAIDMFAVCEIADGNDFVIEGYHIEPEFAAELNSKYPNKLRSVFLIKTDETKFIKNIKKSATPNDWIISRTNDENTYKKIAKMICEYGNFFRKESGKYDFKVFNMDDDFNDKIDETVEYLMGK